MAIAYSPISNVYLVAWHANAFGFARVLAYRVSGSTGAAVGGELLISYPSTLYSCVPRITCNSNADEFEVMYQVSRADASGFNEYGQRVRASDGAMLGGVHPIATTRRARTTAATSCMTAI